MTGSTPVPTPRPRLAVWLATLLILCLCLWFATVGIVLLRHGDEPGPASLFNLPLHFITNPFLYGALAVVAALGIAVCQYLALFRRRAGFSLFVAVVSLGIGITGFFFPPAIPLLDFASEGVRDLILAACLFAGIVMLRWSNRLPVRQ